MLPKLEVYTDFMFHCLILVEINLIQVSLFLTTCSQFKMLHAFFSFAVIRSAFSRHILSLSVLLKSLLFYRHVVKHWRSVNYFSVPDILIRFFRARFYHCFVLKYLIYTCHVCKATENKIMLLLTDQAVIIGTRSIFVLINRPKFSIDSAAFCLQ